jgi:hypothetical protein
MQKVLLGSVMLMFCATAGWAQTKLSLHWEELTAGDFRSAIQQFQGAFTTQGD